MKQLTKIALLLLLVSCGKYLFSQSVSDKKSMLVGKWKLSAHWVERNGIPDYAPVKGVSYIYEFKNDGTYVLNIKYKNQTSVLHGNWQLDELQQTIIFYNSKGNSSELGDFEAPDIHQRIYKLTPDKLHIEAVYYSEEKGTSTYKRIKNK